MNKIAYRWIFILISILLAVDFFYQLAYSNDVFWKTEWFWWRILVVLLIIIFILTYFISIHYKKSEIEKYNFIKNLLEQQDLGYRKIASELHDGLGQNLIVLNNDIIKISNSHLDNPELNTKLKNLNELVSETINEARNISSRLYPQQIEKLGLKKALESMLTKVFNSSDIEYEIFIDNIDGILNKNNEINFYRIIQECVNNILKHSEAKSANIKIKFNAGELITDISDDGIGFITNDYSKNVFTGFGLSNIKHRLLLAGGNFNIDTRPGKGTKIKIYYPIKN